MRLKLLATAAIAVATMVLMPIAADSAPKGGAGNGMRSSGAGMRSSGGGRSFGSGIRSPGAGPRTSGVIRENRGNSGRGEVRRDGGRRGGSVVYGFGSSHYGYDDDDSCYWLKRKAMATGSRYWWRRYQDCVD